MYAHNSSREEDITSLVGAFKEPAYDAFLFLHYWG